MDNYFTGLIIGGVIFLVIGLVYSVGYISLIALAAIASGALGLFLEDLDKRARNRLIKKNESQKN